jgi:hypothetical protein
MQSGRDHADSAEMLAITDELVGNQKLPPVPSIFRLKRLPRCCANASAITQHDDARSCPVDAALRQRPVASASPRRRLFSERDLAQLTEHEAFIHTLTRQAGITT